MSKKESFNFLPELMLSIFSPTILMGRMSGESLINLLEEIGKNSEEIFRGERLPILKDHYTEE